MNLQESHSTLVTVANVAELATLIVQGLGGEAVAASYNGAPLTRTTLHNLAIAELKKGLSNQTGVN